MIAPQQAFANFRRVMASLLALAITVGPTVTPAFASSVKQESKQASRAHATATPIQYLVVIFNENISFDHYFGTYPNALNPEFENKFKAKDNTPPSTDCRGSSQQQSQSESGQRHRRDQSVPARCEQANTADQDHDYMPEQQASDSGLMDLFPLYTGTAGPPPAGGGIVNTNGLVMGYYDGNTVTAMWNYAQNFAMSDNSYGTTFGPSSVGVMNLCRGRPMEWSLI
jgi:phospholipase C